LSAFGWSIGVSAAAQVSVHYLYPFASSLDSAEGRTRLRLATSGGAERNPHFFQGRMRHPRRTADMLLTCSLVSRTRFYHPGELRESLLNAADPVVTSGGERLRFEAFSVCCGVYCRVDLKEGAIDGDWTGRGTTNVDFNPPMRGALASLIDSEAVGLNVGADGVELERDAGTVVEKKVKLPVRWLKGFVEVQEYQARMQPVFAVPAAEMRQLLRAVPQHQTWQKGAVSYVVPAGKGVRLSQRSAGKAVAIGAPGRLKVMEDLLRHATTVRAYAGPDGVSGWELICPEASFHLVLSPEAWRGFSGEGQVLSQLAASDGADRLAKVRAQLQWQAKIDPADLSRAAGVDTDGVRAALTMLGSRGLVGFDLAEGTYFHRELPFDLELVEELQPRLKKARRLVEEKAVRVVSNRDGEVEAYVKGDGAEHRVMLSDDDGRCTCPWYAKHPGERGPCSHMLAVEIATGGDER